ncbi:MAG: sulfurtransferase TusA family protein [Rhodocyclaceae bacterium]|nr:sulfurtransferase TusA family protein [Rhodocyclaceae bacterium]
MADRLLDVCGLKCPMPILRTKKALAAMASGEVLEILVTDPAAREDFAAFARQTGHVLLHVQDGDAQWAIYLRCK